MEGRTDLLRVGDVCDESGVVHDECEEARLVEEVRCVWVHVVDQQVEDYDCVRRGVEELAGAGSGQIGLGAATEMDERYARRVVGSVCI